MGEKKSSANYKELEQNLSQQILLLYTTQLGHQPDGVDCHIVDKTLTIVVDNPITQPERLLAANGKQQFAELIRHNLHKAFQPQLKALVEQVIGVKVVELLGDSSIETGRTSIVVILAAVPN